MNNEIKITLITCIIVFAGVGVLAINTINSSSVIMTQPEIISKQAETKDIDNSPNLIEYPQTSLNEIDENISLKTTTIILNIPENNKKPWAFLSGKVIDAAPGHPVIIQFFKSLDDTPVHIAQIDLNADDSFNYRFRILSIDDGIVTHFFSGDYYIKVFKTVITPT